MDILDDLDLLGDLPDGFDVSLDEILAEYATPGLFSAPVPKFDEIVEPAEPSQPERNMDEPIEIDFASVEEQPEETATAEDSFELGDILFDYGAPVDEDGVKVYSPKSKAKAEEVRLYTPDVSDAQETVPFTAISAAEAAQAEQAAPKKKKRMSWAERRAAKKAAKQQAKAAQKTPSMPASKEAEHAAISQAAELFAEQEAQQAELDAERIAAQLVQEEAAQAQLEAEMEAQAEAELFAWLEATSAYRTKEENAEPEPVPAPVPEAPMPHGLPELEPKESTVPQMEYTLDLDEGEPAPELLLENPDIEPEPSNEPPETPEEAAARKAKEDDNLRYVPEDTPAKTITSAIGKRFSAVFAAFTESGEAGVEYHEEELGPELAPGKAFRFFNKYVKGYRFRLRIAAVLCLVLGWISLGLPVFGSMKNPAVAAAACLMMLLTVMLLGADILATGVRSLLQKKPGAHALVAVSCIASVIDAMAIIICKGAAGYLPFCAVSAVSMCFAIYGSLLYCRGQRLNFRALEQSAEPMTISVDYGIVDPETTTVYRTPGHPEGYIHRSEEEDLSETVFAVMAPAFMVLIPVLSLIAAIASKGLGDFFHIMAALFASTASFSALVAFPLPYFLTERELFRAKASIAGWAGARDLGRVSTMIITDRDLFPDETVSIQSVRIVDHVPPQLTLSYMCSLVSASGSCLVPAFTQLAENNDCDIVPVENFQCHEAGGLSCTIGPDNVLVASHSYMKLQGFRIPARKKDSENALFLAVNNHVIAYIIVDYKAVKSVRAGLESALRGSAEMVFAARDFNITPLLLSKKFKSPTDTLRFPSYSQRYDITSRADSDTAACAAFVSRKSLYPYAVVVEKARNLYRSVTLTVALSAVSTVIGILLGFFMALTGAGAAVTVSRLLIYMLLWLIPTLALSISITQ